MRTDLVTVRRLFISLGLLLVCGCSTPARLRTPERYARGLTVVLPGIEGKSILNRNLALGLEAGGVLSAIEVYDWTYGVPGLNVFNLTNIDRNRRQAERLARRIVQYRGRYADRPVTLIGHSGGAGIAVLALEALPPAVQIEQAILLAPAISEEYDLTPALRRTRAGICNFYSKLDVGLLVVGTTIFVAIDREHGPSAGAVGFSIPPRATEATRQLYATRLQQVQWTPRLRSRGATGLHAGWTTREFASEYLAPIVHRHEVPQIETSLGATPRVGPATQTATQPVSAPTTP